MIKGKDLLSHIDNASLGKAAKWQRLVSKLVAESQVPWTAVGHSLLDSRASVAPSGRKRGEQALRTCAASYHPTPPFLTTVQVGRYVCVTRGPFFKAVTAERKAGAYCVLPLDLQLPSDAAAFRALDLRDFNGNVHELLQICPEVLELDDDSLSLVTRVPRAVLWQYALEEKLMQLICTAIYTHRVLKDFSTPLPEYKPTQWLRAKVSCPSPPSPHPHLTPHPRLTRTSPASMRRPAMKAGVRGGSTSTATTARLSS